MAKKTVKTEETSVIAKSDSDAAISSEAEQTADNTDETAAETPVIAGSDSDAAISSEAEQTTDKTDETAANSEASEPQEPEAATAETPVIAKSDSDAAISPEAAEPDKTAYTVRGCNIRHNGKTYKEGSMIALTNEEAARLKKYLKG